MKVKLFLKRLNILWQKSTPFLAGLIIIQLILRWNQLNTSDFFQWFLWLHLALLMIHEFEEYIFPGGFQKFINYQTVLSKNTPLPESPIGEISIFLINMGVWLWIIIGALFYDTKPWIGTAAVLFQIGNCFGHIILFQVKKPGYNPGILSAVYIFVPFITIFIWYTITQDILLIREWILAIALAILGIAVMVASPYFLEKE